MTSKFSQLPDISNIQPDRLIKYRVSKDGFSAEVLLPGLSYTDFDHKIGGKMNLWSMAKLFECLRYSVLVYGFAHFDKLKDAEHSIFMASSSYQVTNAGNSLNSKKHWSVSFPMHADMNIIHAGSSAFTFETKLTDHMSGDLLMTACMTFVYIDYRTRRPAKFPDWYEDLKRHRSFGAAVVRLPTPAVPKDVFQYTVHSNYSDIDHNGHVNQSVYVKWCTDAGTEAALKGLYSGFTSNIGKYALDRLDIKYIGEGIVDEDFVVNTWQDSDSLEVLHFVVMKGDKVTTVARFKYNLSEISSKL